MKDAVLVLGAGNSTRQILRVAPTDEEAEAMSHHFAGNFREVVTLDMDRASKPTYVVDLMAHTRYGDDIQLQWPVKNNYFDEVHAYEVLEHLVQHGNFRMFFALWRKVWDVLKPGGLVCATTPWWQSQWAWQDPGHMMCYSPGLLSFLSQAQYEKQVGHTAMTDYREWWPKPYDFPARIARQMGDDPVNAGFQFILQKQEAT